jgi:hypothetical protein
MKTDESQISHSSCSQSGDIFCHHRAANAASLFPLVLIFLLLTHPAMVRAQFSFTRRIQEEIVEGFVEVFPFPIDALPIAKPYQGKRFIFYRQQGVF